ncbi:MAG: hypothetical protein WC900_00595, partial [Oscillospiraceae bacterium]
ISSKYALELSTQEIKKKAWLLNVDGVFRMIPINSELIDLINNLMKENRITTNDLINEINANKDIDPEIYLGFKKQTPNIWHYQKGLNAFIYFDLKEKQINDILNMEVTESNYTTLEVILYSLFKLIGMEQLEARKKAISTLTEHKIYSMEEKSNIINRKLPQSELNNLLSSFDIENMEIVNNIISAFKAISDIKINYANKKLSALQKNLEMDLIFVIAFIGLDLTNLKDLSYDSKKNFLDDIKKIIVKYENHKEEEPTKLYDDND